VTRGRYQPFGNHHAAVFNYFADKDDADTVYVFADDTHGERLPTSPATGEEVAEMIEASYENDYEVDFDVEAVPHDGLNPLSYSGPLSVLGEDPVFFTREEEFAEKAKTWSDVLSYLGVDMDVDYEPREDHTPFERFPGEVETSSTNIRQSILNGDEWRAYVSDSVEDFVNESDEFQEALVPEEDQNPSKHKDLVKSRVPGL
jgi:nicotinamide mononucleotide adenylyltransferase